jgi:hypothetical protein
LLRSTRNFAPLALRSRYVLAALPNRQDITMTDEPTRQAIAAKERSGKLTVSGKLKVALDLMLFEGSCRKDSAKAAGLKDHSLREAMRKTHVKAYYNRGLEVLRESERARNILSLVAVRDGEGHTNPMARVSAAKALEQIAEPNGPGGPGGGRGGARAGYMIDLSDEPPGIVIRIHQPPPEKQPRPGDDALDITPNGNSSD